LELIGGDHMTRYFFHIRDGWEVIPDEEGMEFSTPDLAEAEAYASARDLSISGNPCGSRFAAYAIELVDEAGNVLRRIKIQPDYRAA
jgi:hypothetical protein